MKALQLKAKRYTQRKIRVRARIEGTPDCPRLTVFRSNSHIYGQLIDDIKGKALVSVSDLKIKEKGKKTEIAAKVGEELAKKAIAQKIKKVVFDRNGFKFHGRVKALAEGARKGGLDF
jgi:large subunit ribosomal protein L18